ncbi:MAG: VRR-NUC domain-containing protein [Ruminococcus sp.]|jgi:hypothetical protein|nr:VRR-NUC domain-containing protein [Ruminococcus sp.]
MTESELVYAVMRELGKHGAVYRCNSGSVKLPNGKRFNGMPKGFADIMLVRSDGVACFIECKTDKGKLSPEQERFIERMQGLNARAGVARSVDEAMNICELHTELHTV